MANKATGTRKPPGKKGGGNGGMGIVPAAKTAGATAVGFGVSALVTEAVGQAMPADPATAGQPGAATKRSFVMAAIAAVVGGAFAFGASKVKALRKFVAPILGGTAITVGVRALPALGQLGRDLGDKLKPKPPFDEGQTFEAKVMAAGGVGKQMGGEMPHNNRVRDLVN